jgi:CheY-like chemotaxis protein
VRVLIAEDETIIRLDLRGLLEGAGHEVCAEARDGVEAVELARTEEPDVALLDVKMPRLDGIEARMSSCRGRSRLACSATS